MKLTYKKTGNGFPLVILHGLYGSGGNWFTIARTLGQNFTVYLPDQRNHGQTGHSEEMNYNLLTTDLEDFFVENKIQESFLIGHSMGGKVAMNFALKNPDKVKKLVVVDIALRAYRTDGDFAPQAYFHRRVIDLLLSIDIQSTDSRDEIDAYLATFITQPEVRQFLLKNLKRDNHGKFYWGLNLRALDKNIFQLLDAVEFQERKFPKPTLLISGKKSGYIKPGDIEQFKDVFLDFEHFALESGHWVHVEQADKFMEILVSFLNKN